MSDPTTRDEALLAAGYEPLWSLPEAAAVLGTTVPNLVNLMCDHKGVLSQPIYRTVKRHRCRFLRAQDIGALHRVLYSRYRWHKDDPAKAQAYQR